MGIAKAPRIDWTIVESQTAGPDLVLELDFNDGQVAKDVGLEVEEDYGRVALRFCRLDRRVQRGIAEEILELAERRVRERFRTPKKRITSDAPRRPLNPAP